MKSITASLFAAVFLACVTGTVSAQARVPVQQAHILASVTVGAGIISPYKMLAVPGSEGSRLLIVTGQGESFGVSVLHEVDAEHFEDQRPPLNLCSNASAMQLVSNNAVIIACRSSQELMVVGLVSWRIVSRLHVNFAPIALAVISPGRVVVTSVNSGDVDLIQTSDHSITIIHHVTLHQNSYAVTADPESQQIYVVQPNFGIVALHSSDLSISREYPSEGVPSFGAVIWKHKLLFTDREGYLRILDPETGRLQAVDIAMLLGLNRKMLALRGIDPTDVVSLGKGNFLVVSPRQDSMIIALTGSFPFGVKLIDQVPGGLYGMYALSSRTVYITLSNDKIMHFKASTNILARGTLQVVRTVVGRQLVYAAPLSSNHEPMLAVVDDQNNLFMISGVNGLVVRRLSIPGFVPVGPLAPGPNASLLAVGNFRGVHVIAQVSISGKLKHYLSIETLWPVFSVRGWQNQALLVDRLDAVIGLLDLDTWKLRLFNTQRNRPRTGIVLSDNRLVLIHDTNPDIGYALWADERMLYFKSTHQFKHKFLSYPTDIVSCDGGRSALISFFGDDFIKINTLTGEVLNHIKLPDSKTMQLSTCCDDDVWAVSPDFDIADKIGLNNGLRVIDRIQIPGLDYVFPFNIGVKCESGPQARSWAVTDTQVAIFDARSHGH